MSIIVTSIYIALRNYTRIIGKINHLRSRESWPFEPKPTRSRAEIMAFSDSSETTCSVSSLSSGGYSGGESEALSE